MLALQRFGQWVSCRAPEVAEIVIEKGYTKAERADQGPQYPEIARDGDSVLLLVKAEELRSEHRLSRRQLRVSPVIEVIPQK